MNGEVIYRAGQFFVLEKKLSDGSKVYDLCANSAAGDEVIELYNAQSAFDAIGRANTMNMALTAEA